MSDELLVNETFNSIEGEGKRAGALATFIRLTGCNLRCSYCDTAYAFCEGTRKSVQDIIDRVLYHNVTITGGEPLTQDIRGLIRGLAHHDVNIETNGSIDIRPYECYPHVFFTIDYKCDSSGMSQRMLSSNFECLRPKDVLKFVVGDYKDLEQAKEICERYSPKCNVYVSPVFGKITPVGIVEYIKRNSLQNWKLQLQLHKYIWNPNERGV